MKFRNPRHADKIELQMTPMIDIVFQLLVFFVMTFKIVQPEGDFNIKMPQAAPQVGPPSEDLPPMTVRLQAGPDGQLTSIHLNERSLSSFKELRTAMMQLVGSQEGASSVSAEVEIDADYGLQYSNTMRAISAISGYVDPDTGTVVKLIDKIRLAPPKKQEPKS